VDQSFNYRSTIV